MGPTAGGLCDAQQMHAGRYRLCFGTDVCIVCHGPSPIDPLGIAAGAIMGFSALPYFSRSCEHAQSLV